MLPLRPTMPLPRGPGLRTPGLSCWLPAGLVKAPAMLLLRELSARP